MIDTPTCIDCDRGLIPAKLWNAADRGDRQQWKHEGLARAGGRERCGRCVDRLPRLNPIPTTHLAPDPCGTCGTTMVRGAAWKRATVTQRHEWRADGLALSGGKGICHLCYQRAYWQTTLAKRGNEPAPPPKLDTRIHDQSPDVLTEDEGRWVTGRGPSGLPIQVWQAA